MNTEIIKSIGKSSFIEKFPWLFALMVFIGTEIGLYVISSNNNLANFSDNPFKLIGVLALKLLIFMSLAYGYRYLKVRSKKV